MTLLFSMPGTGEYIYMGLVVIYILLIISKVRRTLLRGDISLNSKLVWTGLLVFIPIIGLAIYNFSDISKPTPKSA